MRGGEMRVLWTTTILLAACGGPPKGGDTATADTSTATSPSGSGGPGTGATATGAGTGTATGGTTATGGSATGSPTGTATGAGTGTASGTGTATGTTETGDTGPPPRMALTLDGPVVCDDPSARDEAVWDLIELPGEPLRAFWLIGVGVAMAELDGDPELELLRARETEVERYDRMPDGTWAAGTPLPIQDPSNLSVADIDGDGDRDVFVGGLDYPNKLFLNDGMGNFEDATEAAGLGELAHRTMSAAWSDFDRDGDLDLVVGDYGTFPTEIENAEESQLFLNDGDGTFTDVSDRLPLEVHQGYVFMSGWFDVNRDGWPDMFSVHDYHHISNSRLLIADGAGGFLVDDASLFHPSFFGMGFAAQDINGDGVPDLVQSGFNRISLLQSLPSADAIGGYAWIEHSAAMNLTLLRGLHGGDPTQTFGWGTTWQDLDNDRDLDLAMAFGDWEPELEGGGGGRPLNPHPDALWLRDGESFVEVAAAQGFDDLRTNRGLAAGDVDRDGWLDLAVVTQDGPTTLREGRCGTAHWVNVRIADHTTANTEGVGAEVVARTAQGELHRWITAGSSSMFSAEPVEAHFGLGDDLVVDELIVTFPDGEEARFADVPADHFVVVHRNDVD